MQVSTYRGTPLSKGGRRLFLIDFEAKLECNRGFSFPDRSVKKIIKCVAKGSHVADWNFLDSCYPGIDSYLVVNINKSLNQNCIKW